MAASSLGDFITVVGQMKEHDINVKMFGTSGAVSEFQEELATGEPGFPTPLWSER